MSGAADPILASAYGHTTAVELSFSKHEGLLGKQAEDVMPFEHHAGCSEDAEMSGEARGRQGNCGCLPSICELTSEKMLQNQWFN